MKIVVISGPPGSGKTSISRLLSANDPYGVHLESDTFFHFLSHRIDPSDPGAQVQNKTVVRAYISAAVEYVAGGYTVYLDGVIGPWLLPTITATFPRIDYVLLHTTLDEALSRVKARQTQPSASSGVVGRMHEQFSAILTEFHDHVIETNGKSIRQTADEFLARSAEGAFVYERT
jgi:cytidylate kinase